MAEIERVVMGSEKTPRNSGSVIAPGCRIDGDLSLTGPLVLEGEVFGQVICEGTLIVGPKARIEGSVQASEIIVQGRVKGDIAASRAIEVSDGGQLEGVIYSPSIRAEGLTLIDGDVIIAPERSASHVSRGAALAQRLTNRKAAQPSVPDTGTGTGPDETPAAG